MNERFRGCGVDRLDDRRAKGSLQFKRVLGHETSISMPTHPSRCFPSHGVQGRFMGLYDSFNVVNGWSHNPAFNVSDIKTLTWTFEIRCARTSGSPIKGKKKKAHKMSCFDSEKLPFLARAMPLFLCHKHVP